MCVCVCVCVCVCACASVSTLLAGAGKLLPVCDVSYLGVWGGLLNLQKFGGGGGGLLSSVGARPKLETLNACWIWSG